jgi:hypothetical protein
MSEDKTVQAQPVEKVEVNPAVAPKDETPASELYQKKEAKVVPEAKFLEYKKENKEIKKELASLKQLIAEGATKKEVNEEIESLAKEHNIDTDFLKKLSSTIEKDLSKKLTKSEVKEEEDKEEEDERSNINIDKAFNEHFDRVIQHLPEFQGIVNKEIIKSLALDPKNGNKTLTQLIEDTYSAVLSGKKTLDSAKPGGGKEPQSLDFKKAQTDAEYRRNVVFADPDLKRQYNAKMLTRGL